VHLIEVAPFFFQENGCVLNSQFFATRQLKFSTVNMFVFVLTCFELFFYQSIALSTMLCWNLADFEFSDSRIRYDIIIIVIIILPQAV